MSVKVTPINTFRLVLFPDLPTALASNRLIGYGEVAMVLGDNSRFKWGYGYRNSAKNPAAPTAPTFANLPYSNTTATSVGSFAAPATATLTAAQLAQKYIITTSAAATTLTLPTAVLLQAALGAVQGTKFSFTVDNTGGANTVTVAVGVGIVAGAGAITGNTTLTVPAGQFGEFAIIFKSATAALIYRTL